MDVHQSYIESYKGLMNKLEVDCNNRIFIRSHVIASRLRIFRKKNLHRIMSKNILNFVEF